MKDWVTIGDENVGKIRTFPSSSYIRYERRKNLGERYETLKNVTADDGLI